MSQKIKQRKKWFIIILLKICFEVSHRNENEEEEEVKKNYRDILIYEGPSLVSTLS